MAMPATFSPMWTLLGLTLSVMTAHASANFVTETTGVVTKTSATTTRRNSTRYSNIVNTTTSTACKTKAGIVTCGPCERCRPQGCTSDCNECQSCQLGKNNAYECVLSKPGYCYGPGLSKCYKAGEFFTRKGICLIFRDDAKISCK